MTSKQIKLQLEALENNHAIMQDLLEQIEALKSRVPTAAQQLKNAEDARDAKRYRMIRTDRPQHYAAVLTDRGYKQMSGKALDEEVDKMVIY